MVDRKARNTSLLIYLAILCALCAGFVAGARLLGRQGLYLAQGYMLTPALAAGLTRLFFYRPRFTDAHLGLGRARDYLWFWAASVGITALSFVLFAVLGGTTWDLTGQVFLDQLEKQFAAAGQSMAASLPPGLTPRAMLWLTFVGGLTLFNLLPGVITGFGEEFGARGLMFPLLYEIRPWVGFVGGGLLWYAWHLPLTLVIPQAAPLPAWQTLLNHLIVAIGSICTATYLAYVYVKSGSVWVTSVAHATLDNAARSFAYFAVVRSQLMANAGLTLTMLLVVVVLLATREFAVFAGFFGSRASRRES